MSPSAILVAALGITGGLDCEPFRSVEPHVEGRVELSAAPLFTVGFEERTPLFQVRGAVVLGDGSLVVGEQSTGMIHLFDRTGVLVESHGGTGSGPGEFQRLADLDRLDSIRVVGTDQVQNRAIVVDLASGASETITLQGANNPLKVLPEASGEWIVVNSPVGSDLLVRDGWFRPPLRITRHQPGGELEGIFGVALSVDVFKSTTSTTIAPFARMSRVAIDPSGCVFLSLAESRQVQVLSAGGEAVGRLSLPDSVRTSVSRREWDDRIAYMASLAGEPAVAAALEEELREELEFSPARPTLAGITVDQLGWVWVEAYHPPEQDADGWWLFSSLARAPTWVRAPTGTRRLLGVGPEQVAVLSVDDWGVETVDVFGISRR